MKSLGCTLFACIGISLLGSMSGSRIAVGEEKQPSPSQAKDYAAELPRLTPLSPSEAIERFELAPGFRIELIAAEPLVMDPVAFSFDGQGNLFVVEMIDYSEQENDFLGRVVRLSDSDRDGRMDQRTVFVDKLSWPTAVHVWKDGVVVIAPPNLTWYRDTDGDGCFDESENWSEGFGRSNVQGMANSLRWSVEGYLVGATSSSGAHLTGGWVGGSALDLRGRDFRLDPLAKRIEAISGGGQHGAAFNRWRDRFVTSNSDHLQQIIDVDDWLSTHPTGSLSIVSRRSIAVDGPQAEVFRSSPVEPWRIVRTRLRVSGEAPGAIEGGGRAAGYFTGATGTWIADAEAGFGVEGFDTAFACDVGSNLVHRKKLEPAGLFWSASRIDHQSEFLRSSDIWFRPVQLGDGPDGALYVADMYREVIEHPKSLPPMIKQHLDLTSGNDRGRIWRVSRIDGGTPHPTNDSEATSSAPIAKLDNRALVGRLSSPIAWQRRMASQLLLERQATDVAEMLRSQMNRSIKPETQVLAMHLLFRLGLLDETTLQKGLNHPDPRVNRHAIQLANQQGKISRHLSQNPLSESLLRRSDDRLRWELAKVADQLPLAERMAMLRQLMSFASDPNMRSVIIVAAADESWRLLSRGEEPSARLSQQEETLWLASLLPYWSSRLALQASETAALRENLKRFIHDDLDRSPERTWLWADAIAKLPSSSQADRFWSCWAPDDLTKWKTTLRTAVEQADRHPAGPTRQIAWLRFAGPEQRSAALQRALAPDVSPSVQAKTIEACLWAAPQETAETLLRAFSSLTPKEQEPILLALLGQSEAAASLADAVEKKRIPASQITPSARQRMSNHPSSSLRKRFATILSAFEPSDESLRVLIERYRAVLDSASGKTTEPSALERGKALFQKHCAACHRIGEDGQDVGPPLKSLHEKSPEQLLVSILDPNREVDPRFQAYSILMEDGRVLSGVIREESANQLVLAESGGKLTAVPRNEVEQLKGSGQSLMPQGLQQQILPEDMLDLIAWLRSVKLE